MSAPRKARNIVEACESDALFADWFRRGGDSWRMWFAFLRVLFGLPVSPEHLEIFQQCTHRTEPRDNGYLEAWLVCGRRGGKSFILALIAVWLAMQMKWQRYLQPGEMGTLMIIAADRKQARAIFKYIHGFLDNIPVLSSLKAEKGQTNELITLTNQIQIEIHTTSFRTTRGYTLIACLLDEIAFWKNEGTANPDEEILEALRPGLVTIPGSMLLAASSPYARRGVLYDTYKRHFGVDDSGVLVWQAPTWVMNPTIPRDHQSIAEAYDRDPVRAESEYGAEFRGDVSGFFPDDVIDRAINVSRPHEIEPDPAIKYYGFVDASGGRHDDFVTSIGHYDETRDVIVVDVLRCRRPPFDPAAATEESCIILKEYGVYEVEGDSYSGEWAVAAYEQHGIAYRRSPISKSEIYLEAFPSFTRGRVDLSDDPRLRAQMTQLERRVGRRNTRDAVDHPPGGRDDLINAACGVVVRIARDVDVEIDIAGGSVASDPVRASYESVDISSDYFERGEI